MSQPKSRFRSLVALLALLLASACGPSDPLERVRTLQDARHDHAAVLEPLRALLAERPDDPELNYRYGTALTATGQRGLALFALENAMTSPEWRPLAAPLLVTSHVAARNFEQALAVCERLLEDDPDDIRALMLRARVRMVSLDDYDALLADAERMLELDPDHHDALVPRAVALLGLNRVDEAGQALEDLEALYRDESLGIEGSPHFCIAGASFAEEKGELETAEERYEHCYETFPAEPVVIEATAKFFDAIEKPERSLELLRAAIEAFPESNEVPLAVALRLRETGDVEAAETVLEEAAERMTGLGAAEAWATLGSFRMESGDPDEAVAAFERARSLDATKSAQLVLGLADALIVAGRYEDALALSEEMTLPAHREVVAGRALLALDKPDEAQRRFDAGLRLWPDSAVARYYSAIAAERRGDFKGAIEDYRYSMRIDSNATDAFLRLARLHAAAGQFDNALWALSFQAGRRPEEIEGALLQVRVRARTGRLQQAPPALIRTLSEGDRLGATVAAMGEGVRARDGGEAALEMMRAFEPLDLTDPGFADALEAIVEQLAALGRADEGLALVRASLKPHPDDEAFQAIEARALRLVGAPAEQARAGYRRVLEGSPEDQRALRGLADLERAEGELATAWALFERSLALDPHDPATALAAAETLVALDRASEAEDVLAELLLEHPYQAEAARRLAELRVARGARDDRTRELARRAVTFGGGQEAESFLESLQSKPAGETTSSG